MTSFEKSPRTRRWKGLLILLAVSALIGSLIYFEQIAVLYVLSTLALIALLVSVAMTDLEKVGETIDREPTPKEVPPTSQE